MRKYLAEFIGTFTLVFCGTGAVVINEVSNGQVTHAGIAITFGLVVMAMIYAVGDVSGAHLNPAVTIAFAVNKNFEWKKTIPYLTSQLSGAIAASTALKLLFPANSLLGATIPGGSAIQSFILEVLLTFFLMFVILQVATGSKEQGMFAGLAIGSVVLLEAMFAGPVSGASMNPARSLAPAIVSGHFNDIWVYLTAPFIGALIAVIVCKIIKQ
ncbi:MAG: MIP family channel protein [Sphingobacteriales bacterium]|nr:MAG: MIP family channel protein [Sphingobacteriales bacterium]